MRSASFLNRCGGESVTDQFPRRLQALGCRGCTLFLRAQQLPVQAALPKREERDRRAHHHWFGCWPPIDTGELLHAIRTDRSWASSSENADALSNRPQRPAAYNSTNAGGNPNAC